MELLADAIDAGGSQGFAIIEIQPGQKAPKEGERVQAFGLVGIVKHVEETQKPGLPLRRCARIQFFAKL